ncbi:threonylcarbamoyl-AMP synthase [Patescibacteria group bacterium]|nr:threonylcarbamoyl-AMP synthase [Patescibacteria group bacterium]MBU1075301.1 threonylcarbamoyl-AMP synthase [Patescibacteria group bacterium]MBU1952334.1 threonylcarbamoyl-AMP synthase [Patescibacteria group bacterium]
MEQIFVSNKKLSKQTVQKIVTLLEAGGVIIYPTETAYAIGGDARNKKTIKKIYQIKKRTANFPLPVIVGNIEQAKKFALFDPVSSMLAKKYWPGALTLVLKKKKGIPALLTAGKQTIAMRVSGNSIAREIAKGLGGPIISTSANDSMEKECYSVKAIQKQISNLEKKVALVVNIGKLPKVKPSTIVKASSKKIVLLRRGSITF